MTEHGYRPDMGGQPGEPANGRSLDTSAAHRGGINALNTEQGDRAQFPDARQVLDRLDSGLLQKALELGAPRFGEPKLDVSEVQARYEPLSRDRFSEVVGIDALRAEAQGGRKSEISTDEGIHSHRVVYETPEGIVKVSETHIGPDDSSLVMYEQLPAEERVSVQHSEHHGGTTRLFDLKLGEGSYQFGSERHSKNETRIHVHGTCKDDPEGNVTKANIETGRFDGK
jgi:hypothetical protein